MIMKKLAAAAIAAMLATSSLGLSAFAAEEESSYTKRAVKAYRYNPEVSDEIDCLFTNDNPDLPYVDLEEFLNGLFTVTFRSNDMGDGVFEISGNNGSLVVDTEKDTVVINNLEKMAGSNAVESESLGGKYAHEKLNYSDSIVELDFSKYGIDLLADEGQVYLPLNTMTDIFGITYNSAVYLDGSIYFHHTSDIFAGEIYYDMSGALALNDRTQAMADYTYNELCFMMDKIYGAPSKSQLAASIREKGFDKTLDEYSEVTKAAKEHLKTTSWGEFYYGLFMLSPFLEDGGHTSLVGLILQAMQTDSTADTPLMKAFTVFMGSDDEMAVPAKMWMQEQSMEFDQLDFRMARMEEFGERLGSVKQWGETTELLADDDTAVFVFDDFVNDVVEPFKWSVDYAAEHGLKNFIVDLSTNKGGDSSVVAYMLGLMSNKKNADNEFSYNMRSTLSDAIIPDAFVLDYNLDGVFDDKDKEVSYDLNFGILSSRVSFSCGNMMPCLAQEYGIPVLGETSGGGGCMVGINYYPNGAFNSISSLYTIIRNDGTEVDSGVTVDYELPVSDENKNSYYDIDLIKKDMDDFYGIASNDESSEPESSVSEADSSSDTESEPADTSSGSTSKSADNGKTAAGTKGKSSNPPTGTAASIALAAVSIASLIVVRRKNR